MTIEIRTVRGDKYAGRLVVDGASYPKIRCRRDGPTLWDLGLPDTQFLPILLAQPAQSLKDKISAIIIYDAAEYQELAEGLGASNINLYIYPNMKPALSFTVSCKMSKWKKDWSHQRLVNLISERLETKSISVAARYDSEDYVDIDIELRKIKKDYGNAVLSTIEEIAEKLAIIRNDLDEKSGKYTLSIPFEFPSSTKSACEQYLIYFSQFLNDLGIEAVAKVEGGINTTILSVTPSNKSHALSLIKEALVAYLELPNAPDGALKSHQDVAVKQLEANILFLKSQLMLAHATIEQKSITIKLLSDSANKIIEHQPRKSKAQTKVPTSKSEEIFGGMIEVSKIKKLGIQLNLGEIARRLKRRK